MLCVQRLIEGAKIPTCEHPGEDLGYDVYALEDARLITGVPTKVRTGIAVCFQTPNMYPNNFGLLIRDRSSMASKGIFVTAGVVDTGYRGELLILMTLSITPSAGYYQIRAGDKIAQLLPIPVVTQHGITELESLPFSSRGTAGWGSSGR